MALQPSSLLVASPLSGPGWLHELKYDGYRIGLVVTEDGAGRRATLLSRRHLDWTNNFPAIAAAAATLPARSVLIDGEVVVLLPDGRTDFSALQNASRACDPRLVYYAFDRLFLDGQNLERLALTERNWQKSKCVQRQEFVVGGYLTSAGAPLAALHVGYYEQGSLRFAGKVGTGFQSVESALLARLKSLSLPSCPFAAGSRPKGKDFREAVWVRPTMVIEVEFLEWTPDLHVRHPSFKGVREDKDPATVRAELPEKALAAPSD